VFVFVVEPVFQSLFCLKKYYINGFLYGFWLFKYVYVKKTKKYKKNISLIYFQLKNIFKKHSTLYYQIYTHTIATNDAIY